jgi:hypothetical protein
MTNAAEFSYEVAFSFLDQDEAIARQLSSLLAPITTFVYSEQHLAVAATDGVDTFSSVFRRDARIVAVLFRTGWGKTKWTRIEEQAIESRLFEDGPSFIIVIKLDDSESPAWFPSTRIWVDFNRFGAAGAASVIQERVKEGGGAVRAETPQDNAARLERERTAETRRIGFLKSEEGVAAANQAFEQLLQRLERISEEVGATFLREGHRLCQVYRDGFSVQAGWTYSYRNTLDDSALHVSEWEGRPNIGAHRFFSQNRRELVHHEFHFDVDSDRSPLWRERARDGRIFMPDGLADWCVHLLLNRVRGNIKQR